MKRLILIITSLGVLTGCVTDAANIAVLAADAFYFNIYPEIKNNPPVEQEEVNP